MKWGGKGAVHIKQNIFSSHPNNIHIHKKNNITLKNI